MTAQIHAELDFREATGQAGAGAPMQQDMSRQQAPPPPSGGMIPMAQAYPTAGMSQPYQEAKPSMATV